VRIRRRRRVDIAVLAGVVLLAGVAAVAGVVAATPERVARLWAGAEVGRGGAASVTEVIDYDFAGRQRHGIYRDVPGLDPADPVRVHSDSAPDQFQVTGTAHQTRLRIGDPNRTVTGRHRYTIGYRLAGVVPATWLVRRAGRERVTTGGAAEAAFGLGAGPERRVDPADLGALATVEFVPPGELTPAQGGVLLAETVRPEHKVAWLIGAAIDGHLEIEGDGPVTLVRLPHQGPPGYLLDVAFAGRDRLTLGGFDPQFADAWKLVGNELEGWRRTCGLWDPAGDRRRALVRVLGVLAGVAGLALAGVGAALAARAGAGWLVVVAAGGLLAGAGAAAAVGAWELRVRTPAGSALWLRTESFRRFLAASEAHHAEEAAKRGHLRQYTAWAVAVGELDRWSRAVAASSVPAADPAVARYPLLGPTLLHDTSRSVTEPSSGGSGGGGSGGGVGGGAGGGGGGSW
jgi:hypothetical protein